MNLGDPQVAWVGMLFNGNKRIRLVVLNAFRDNEEIRDVA